MCRILNTTPIPEEMPTERNDLADDTQFVFFIYDKLPSIWEGFSGQYMGKDLKLLPVLLDFYKVEHDLCIYAWEIIPIIDNIVAEEVSKKIRRKLDNGVKSGQKSGKAGNIT